MNTDIRKRRAQRERKEAFSSAVFRLIVLILLPVYAVMMARVLLKNNTGEIVQETQEVTVTPVPAEEETEPIVLPHTLVTAADLSLAEGDVFTFLQGPKAWNAKTEWSGSWCEQVLAGQRFSVFGCGHCCMANIYSTLTPYFCSPVDMFDLAREVTAYAPNANYGAIAWDYMKQSLEYTGIVSTLMTKDATYEEFQQKMANGISAIVNVNSANDNTYWKDVTGHYINIWLYNSADDTVFLADSGNPEHNRQRIPLKYVYDAMKTADSYQYMLVTGYYPDGNNWQKNGIAVDWTSPW